jgi:hypothetical protein
MVSPDSAIPYGISILGLINSPRLHINYRFILDEQHDRVVKLTFPRYTPFDISKWTVSIEEYDTLK